jgi:hypothetical protein
MAPELRFAWAGNITVVQRVTKTSKPSRLLGVQLRFSMSTFLLLLILHHHLHFQINTSRCFVAKPARLVPSKRLQAVMLALASKF